jgi:NADPH:quinone reductase-like Zn-dependent oxidoreductase
LVYFFGLAKNKLLVHKLAAEIEFGNGKSLGAKRVIDYTQEYFTQNSETHDVVFDADGKTSQPHCKPVSKQNGSRVLPTGSAW